MPNAWSDKDERQYKHIKESNRKRGMSTDRAEEIAARTVNKQRRKDGKTKRQSTLGTGNPNSKLDDRTKNELYNIARNMGIQGRSRMSKGELVSAIRGRR